MDRKAAKDAGMGQPMITERHENDLDVGIEFDRGSELHFEFSATDPALRPGMGRESQSVEIRRNLHALG
jgi:hypothetical protein